jgi:hypothetical protein
MAKDKYDFIKELLEDKKINQNQRERILELASREISLAGTLEERVQKIEEIVFNEKIEGNKPTNENLKSETKHDPSKVTNYLKKFKENTALKFTTHIWDLNKYEKIIDFIDELNEDKSHTELFSCNRNLYNLIQYFIYNPNQKLNELGIPEFGWRNFPEIRIGWQFPNDLLINWCRENYDNQDNKKTAFEYSLPKEFKPKKPIKGKMITTFENVADVFKTEIQFRDNYLYNELKKRQNKMKDFDFVDIDKFENLDFYTYTSGVLSAIDTILNEIKKNETAKMIHFSYKFESDQLLFDIAHINSYSHRQLNENNLLQFLGGGLNSIYADIISLCDFSVISKFKNTDNKVLNAELCILHNETKAVWEGKELKLISQPILRETTEEIKGFTYRLKFRI